MIALAAWLSVLIDPLVAPQEPAPQQPAPTPPPRAQVEWQRSLDDALAVQKATGLPLLIAVNMDGEHFNELFAGAVYRDAKFVETTRGYVCVVASPDRHTEADHDSQGRRIECPRFGGCTCGEHIAIEPLLFERWFEGKRNAPRHLAVSPAGKVMFDRFLDASMETAIDAIRRHRGTPKGEPAAPAALETLFARRDAAARRAIEQRYAAADAAGRRSILAAAVAAAEAPHELLRMALRDPDETVFAAAAAALAKHATSDMRDAVENALARVDDPAVVAALLARLAEIGRDDPAATRLAAHLAPGQTPTALALPWSGAWRAPAFTAGDRASIEAELDRCEAQLRAQPNDEPLRLRLAIAQAAFADVLIAERGRNIGLWFADSQGNANRLRNTTLQNEAHALIAWTAYMTGDAETAARSTTLAWSPAKNAREPDPWLAARACELSLLTTVNGVHADAEAAGRRHLTAELARARALLDLLAQRGGGQEQPLLAGIGLLEFAGLRSEARHRLARLAEAFPAAPDVHERWRQRIVADLGVESLPPAYAKFLAACGAKPEAQCFAGCAALAVAEQRTKDGRSAEALAAYGQAVDGLARVDDDGDLADFAHHQAVLALAGRAHLRFAAGDAQGAVQDLLRAAELRPESLDETDGLLRKPRAVAARIQRELAANGRAELAAQLAPVVE